MKRKLNNDKDDFVQNNPKDVRIDIYFTRKERLDGVVHSKVFMFSFQKMMIKIIIHMYLNGEKLFLVYTSSQRKWFLNK